MAPEVAAQLGDVLNDVCQRLETARRTPVTAEQRNGFARRIMDLYLSGVRDAHELPDLVLKTAYLVCPSLHH
jgi:hypothetical protein